MWSKFKFKAINLIAETFEQRDVKFDVVYPNGSEQILAGFFVDCGPCVIMRFISRDNDNDVAARIFGLISNIPKEKRSRVLEACNMLNRKFRYMEFHLDSDGNINVEYDFPVHTPDNGIGEMAFEILVRTMAILDEGYNIFMKALYSEEDLDSQEYFISPELVQNLQRFRKMKEAQIFCKDDSVDEEADDFDTADSPNDIAC